MLFTADSRVKLKLQRRFHVTCVSFHMVTLVGYLSLFKLAFSMMDEVAGQWLISAFTDLLKMECFKVLYKKCILLPINILKEEIHRNGKNSNKISDCL